jgi:hypothetical protein
LIRRSWTLDTPLLFRHPRWRGNLRDELGVELNGIEAARDEATRGLADFARDALPGSVRRELAVECRDEADRDVLRAALSFEVAVLAS